MAEEQGHISVIEDFTYDSENPQYNEDFRHWRRCTKEPFIYRFTDNTKETVYSTDVGKRQNAADAERSALSRCGELIGAALLAFLLIELGGGSLLTLLLSLFHVDIRMDFLTLSMNGSQWAVVSVKALTQVLQYALPTILLVRLCKIPQSVSAPVRPGAVPETVAAFAAGMLIAGIYSLLAQREGVETAQRLFTLKDMAAITVYGFFETLVAAVLAEAFLRGAVMTLLRQFGDLFAIIATASMAFFFPNPLSERVAEFMIGLAAGYLLVRSGSIAKCVMLRITYTGLSYARLVAIYSTQSMRLWEYALLLISIGTLGIAFFVSIRRNRIRLGNIRTALRAGEKTSAFIQNLTLLPWLAVSILLTLLQLFY